MLYTTDPVIGSAGWAVQRVGPIAVGFWTVSFNEERIEACRRLYRRAVQLHGRVSVFAVFRSNPWSMELATADRTRRLVASMLQEFDGLFDAVICVMDGTGFQGSVLRLGAAAITPLVPRSIPLLFPGSVNEGIALARKKGTLAIVNEGALRDYLAQLEARVLDGR